MIAVVIRASRADRAAEALRAAIGLGLRGERVCVVQCTPLPDDPRIERAVRTLEALSRPVLPAAELVRAVRAASRVEVWT